MRRTVKRTVSLAIAMIMCLSLVSTGALSAGGDDPGAGLRPMEYLTRGLVAMKIEEGVFLSWRFLGNEPDDIVFNVYRDGEFLAAVSARSNYTDALGTVESVYEVSAVTDGVEGVRQGTTVPMFAATGTDATTSTGAHFDIPLKRPDAMPAIQFVDKTGSSVSDCVYEPVDMELLKAFRVPHSDATPVTQEELNGWIAKLNEYNGTPEWIPVATLGEDGLIGDELYGELEAAFIQYCDELDEGPRLDYRMTEDGKIATFDGTYSPKEISVGDMDGDGEYELVLLWSPSNARDSMYSEPIYSRNSRTTAGPTSSPTIIDCLKLDGTILWRINMGYNIRSGDHDTQLLVGDYNNDGKSEIMIKTSDGTTTGHVDEDGNYTVTGVVGDANAAPDKFLEYIENGDTAALDQHWGVLNSYSICYRSPYSSATSDPVEERTWVKTYHVGTSGGDAGEYFTAFDGATGAILDTVDFPFPFGEHWGVNPMGFRGDYRYQIEGAAPYTGANAPRMQASEQYWLENPWGEYPWGDAQGNRSNRNIGCVAFLDGEHYSAVWGRGYYHRTTLSAFHLDENNKIVTTGLFDSAAEEDPYAWQNRGNHNLSVADVDGDRADEICLSGLTFKLIDGALRPIAQVGGVMPSNPAVTPEPGESFLTEEIINDPANQWWPIRHGDRGHLLPVDADNTLKYYSCREEWMIDDLRDGKTYGWLPGITSHDPLTGEYNVAVYVGADIDGGTAGNFDPRYESVEIYPKSGRNFLSAYNMSTGESLPYLLGTDGNPIWFDGDLNHELISSRTVSKVNIPASPEDEDYMTVTPTIDAYYAGSGDNFNPQKGMPMLQADLFGDWREEFIMRAGNSALRVATTTAPTEYGIRTLMHDPMYRMGVAWQSSCYNMAPHASFFLGPNSPLPEMRTDIYIPSGAPETPANIVFTPVTTESVTITWDASLRAEQYQVYRREAGVSAYTLIATVTEPVHVDYDVEMAHDYYYYVTASNEFGTSAPTNEAFIMVAGAQAVLLNEFNIREMAGQACRLRLGDLDGDGRTDILACNTAYQTSDSSNPRVLYSLTAINIEGEMIWQWFANPEATEPEDRNTKTGADEPVQIQDVDGDGFNEVIVVGNPNPELANGPRDGDILFILDGRTGAVKQQMSFADIQEKTGVNMRDMHDCIVLGNFDGRTVNGRSVNQHIVLKTRYNSIEIFEMIDKETGELVMNHLWGYDSARMNAAGYPVRVPDPDTGRNISQAVTGHYPLVVDLDGDGVDELISNYTVMNAAGEILWKVPHIIYDADGNRAGTATDHVDTIQVGDVDGNPDNGLEVIFGGGGTGMSTFCFYADGSLCWTNNIAHEPQSLILADFRTEATGLETYGLDRRNRSAYPIGHDGLFLIGPKGEDLYKEPDNPQGWSTIVIRVSNWTGTYAPLSLAFFRNDQANATGDPEVIKNNLPPTLYDGYFNKLFELPGPDTRFMVANFVGDAREELIGYTDLGNIYIYGNGEYPLDSLVSGTPMEQTAFLGNYSRYPTDKFVLEMEDREPAAPFGENITVTSAYINWTPVIGATAYELYRNGELLGTFTDVGYQDNAVVPGVEYRYTVRATDGTTVTPESYPFVLQTEAVDYITVALTENSRGITATCAAYLAADIATNVSGQLTAYLEINGALTCETPVENGRVRIYVPAAGAPQNGDVCRLVVKAGDTEGSADVTVHEYSTNIWSATAMPDNDGSLSLKFNAKVGLAKAPVATVAGSTYTPVVTGYDTLGIGVQYDAVPAGSEASVKGVKLVELFPSYSFTYKVIVG